MPLQFSVKLPLFSSLLLGASAALFRDGSSWLSRSRLNASADIAVGATLRRIAEAVRVGRDPVEAGRWWARDGVSGPPTKYNTASKVVKGMVNVHIVPHSHDDVGWLKTVDQYSEGSHNGIQHTNVNLEIDTVLTSLSAPAMRLVSTALQPWAPGPGAALQARPSGPCAATAVLAHTDGRRSTIVFEIKDTGTALSIVDHNQTLFISLCQTTSDQFSVPVCPV
jgi:hypothetical protein